MLAFGTMGVATVHQEIATPSARNDSGSRGLVLLFVLGGYRYLVGGGGAARHTDRFSGFLFFIISHPALHSYPQKVRLCGV